MLNMVAASCVDHIRYKRIGKIINKQNSMLSDNAKSIIAIPVVYFYALMLHIFLNIFLFSVYHTEGTIPLDDRHPKLIEIINTYKILLDKLSLKKVYSPLIGLTKSAITDLEDLSEYLLVSTDSELHTLMADLNNKINGNI